MWDSPCCRWNFDPTKGEVLAEWFINARTNVAFNCLDRHVQAGLGDKVAFFHEGNDMGMTATYTYAAVLEEVCRLANYLRACGVGCGDDVTLYMAHTPQLAMSMVCSCKMHTCLHACTLHHDSGFTSKLWGTSSHSWRVPELAQCTAWCLGAFPKRHLHSGCSRRRARCSSPAPALGVARP